jgi:hypothetical protein
MGQVFRGWVMKALSLEVLLSGSEVVWTAPTCLTADRVITLQTQVKNVWGLLAYRALEWPRGTQAPSAPSARSADR